MRMFGKDSRSALASGKETLDDTWRAEVYEGFCHLTVTQRKWPNGGALSSIVGPLLNSRSFVRLDPNCSNQQHRSHFYRSLCQYCTSWRTAERYECCNVLPQLAR
jgi:hypothetical protein